MPSRVVSPTPHDLRVALGARAPPLPASVDWRRVNGTSFTTRVGYQLLPSPCGSCWAFAAAGALAEAAQAFEKLHSIVPNNPEVIYQIANLADMTGNFQQACKWFLMLITRVPTDAGVLARLERPPSAAWPSRRRPTPTTTPPPAGRWPTGPPTRP